MGGIESRSKERERRLSPVTDIDPRKYRVINHGAGAIKLFPLRLHLRLRSRALAPWPIVIVEDFTKISTEMTERGERTT